MALSLTWNLILPIVVLGAVGQTPPVEGPNTPSPEDRVGAILDALEKRGDGVRDIRCRLRLTEEDRVNLTKADKSGSILFFITEPNPHFLIHIEKSERDGVLGKQEWYLFDGRWLYETLERLKQVTKRPIARPGEKLDLFDIERAPFPVPFGQKKDAILRNFEVSLSPPSPDDPPNSDHLICKPRPDSRMYRKYDRLDFFIHRDLHLPGRIVVTKNGGHEIMTADFPDLSEKSINVGVKREDFNPPPAWKKYKEVVETEETGG